MTVPKSRLKPDFYRKVWIILNHKVQDITKKLPSGGNKLGQTN